jgi:hypothetical protein
MPVVKTLLTEEDCLKIGKILNKKTNRCNIPPKVAKKAPVKKAPVLNKSPVKNVPVVKKVATKILLTEEDCLKIGKVLNPKTNRCNIAKNANANAKVKALPVKKYNVSINKIKSPSVKVPTSFKMSPSRKRKVDAFIAKRSAKIIQKLAKPLLHRVSFNIDDRIKTYNMYYKYLSKYDINQCLKIEVKDKDNITYSLANDNIKIVKRIGTASAYGAIYKSKGNNEGELFRFSSKIMESNEYNLNEVKILKDVTNIVISKKNPHFPIMYYNFNCNYPQENANLPSYINNKEYYINISELANGDASKYILDNYKNDILMNNALAQIFISIVSFHSIGYTHHDTHWGNFLYHKVKPGGYIQYIINGRELYVENIGYLWVIWDFGFATKFSKREYTIDYFIIMNSFKVFSEKKKNALVDKIYALLRVEYKKGKISAGDLFNLFIDNTTLFLKSSDLPKNANILNNKNPYKIGI